MNTKISYPNQDVFERDNYTCQYCDLDASQDFEIWWTANMNIDHIKPVKHGGRPDRENLAVACRACNLYKGSIDCNSREEARQIVAKKKEQARQWYKKHVLKESG
jgi:5-methylcytosine-specific restriction endonuclease McrA